MQRTSTFARITLAILVALTIGACGGGGPAVPRSVPPASLPSLASPSEAASSEAVSIKGFAFTPKAMTVPVGTTVTWTNDEDSLHTVTSGTPAAPSGLFDSGEIDTGVDFSFTFTEDGAYPFFCARHDFMKGLITVTP
jgi:plastocyanin